MRQLIAGYVGVWVVDIGRAADHCSFLEDGGDRMLTLIAS